MSSSRPKDALLSCSVYNDSFSNVKAAFSKNNSAPAYKCVTSNTYKNCMNICNDPSLETFVIGLYMLRSL